MKRLFQISVILISLCLLVACAKKQPAMTLAQYDRYQHVKVQQALLQKIDNGGVKVYREGENVTFLLPIDHFFQTPTTFLQQDKIPVIRQVAEYIAGYRKPGPHPWPNVRVFGYAAKHSDQYAKVIAAYLWNANIAAQIMHVKGRGTYHPIASSSNPKGVAYNRRVIIKVT